MLSPAQGKEVAWEKGEGGWGQGLLPAWGWLHPKQGLSSKARVPGIQSAPQNQTWGGDTSSMLAPCSCML